MRTVSFQSVLHGVAARCGLDGVADGLSATDARGYAEYINTAAKYAWEYYPWPEVLQVEARTPVEGVIAWEPGFGTIIQVTKRHPFSSSNPQPLKWRIGPAGVYLLEAREAYVWVVWRAPAPVFGADPHNTGKTYAAGSVVFRAQDGECYEATEATSTAPPGAAWAKVPMLRILSEAIKAGAYSLTLQEEGQHSTSLLPADSMESLLEHEVDLIERQSGQSQTFRLP